MPQKNEVLGGGWCVYRKSTGKEAGCWPVGAIVRWSIRVCPQVTSVYGLR
jgi:hypothetical protein